MVEIFLLVVVPCFGRRSRVRIMTHDEHLSNANMIHIHILQAYGLFQLHPLLFYEQHPSTVVAIHVAVPKGQRLHDAGGHSDLVAAACPMNVWRLRRAWWHAQARSCCPEVL